MKEEIGRGRNGLWFRNSALKKSSMSIRVGRKFRISKVDV